MLAILLVFTNGNSTSQSNIRLVEGDFASVGGFSANQDVSLFGSSHPSSPLTKQDYQNIYSEAFALLDMGKTYRQTELQNIPAGEITTIDDVLKNYQDFNEGELFYRLSLIHI